LDLVKNKVIGNHQLEWVEEPPLSLLFVPPVGKKRSRDNMRITILLLLFFFIGGHVQAEFETWTSADGRQASLRLHEVVERDGEKIGRFILPDGRVFEIKASELNDESAARLAAWSPPEPEEPEEPEEAEEAEDQTLVTERGADPSFKDLLESRKLVPGANRTEGVKGSTVRVDHSIVEATPYGRRRIEQDIRIHTLAHSSINRNRFDDWTRWYQEHGNTQVFRLFEGETNVRNDRPYSARIEAFSNLTWKEGDGWHEWTGAFTIVKPHTSSIFQVMNRDNEWAVHIEMDDDGNVSVNHRRGPKLQIAERMTGKPFDIRVRDNGRDFEVYLNDQKVTEGSYARPTGVTNFRWGMYRGKHPVTHDAMILVSGATVRSEGR